ncbi:tRNA lysidine(34) synthetase TilS [uncultured Psychroserpens sp.]|uniref:tRNA lysidine(34) synthetase TilS n=1 Tax=uncultured Psychroserpens sp. TaxID=255436 RepID=UPI0026228BF3|nr:tRNA lysidine(34) synthetase TilS [uncultured Psychroserpens sp.]
MINAFKNHIQNNLSLLTKSKLLIACSGGLDSVVLTHLCHELGLDISLAHCNFNLRGTESDEDESFVIDLADQLDFEVFVESFNTEDYAKTHKISIQMAARDLRYNWFFDLAEDLKFDYILTAHHADDNLETFLINLTRGSGLHGLTGIPEKNDAIIRPLLPFTREDLESYANEKNLSWREDSSNTSDKYLRNALRHRVIPALKEINPEVIQGFKQTLSHLNDSADIVEESLNAVAKRAIVDIDDDYITFKISEFKKVNNAKAYMYEMFKDYGFTAWNDVVNLLDAQSGKQVLSETHRLIKDRKHLILTNRVTETHQSIEISEQDNNLQTGIGTLVFNQVNTISNASKTQIFIDKGKLTYPLVLRQWQEGDAFYPSGMKGKKKLSKYFKDEKLSLVDKENIWLLTSNDDIVWILGRRADERFKVTKQTTKILKITLKEV